VFEGIDGSGKSTQVKPLAENLRQKGLTAVLTSEPSLGPVGRRIRSLVKRLAPEEEMELFTEDRKDHVKSLILPALQVGNVVICDRYYYSSAAYQGARGLDPLLIININREFAPQPDITFFLDLTPETALTRITQGRQECVSPFEDLENLRKVAELYALIQDSSFVIIDAAEDPATVQASIWRAVEKHFEPVSNK
jgi:dTMP kinase